MGFGGTTVYKEHSIIALVTRAQLRAVVQCGIQFRGVSYQEAQAAETNDKEKQKKINGRPRETVRLRCVLLPSF